MVFGNKKIFKSKTCEIHVGLNAPEDFMECSISDVKKTLKNLGKMKIWRCHVCNDISISIIPPKTCPTCFQTDAYVEINEKEIKNLLEIK